MGSQAQAILSGHSRIGFKPWMSPDNSDAIVVRTICAYCGESVTGPLVDGRAWFAEHRRPLQACSMPAGIPHAEPPCGAMID